MRQMLIVGANPGKYLHQYSREFQHDFIQLLRSAHGEKRVNANRFYANEYITNKQHLHMNATRWATLTEFVKYLGREGICRVDFDEEDGWFVSWIDNSPEAMRRREAGARRDKAERGEEERMQKMLAKQVERAKEEAVVEEEDTDRELKRDEADKVILSFAPKVQMKKPPNTSNPFKNPFKQHQPTHTATATPKKHISMAEQIAMDEQAAEDRRRQRTLRL